MRKSPVILSVIFMIHGVWAQSPRRSTSASVHFPPAAIAAFQKIDAERIRAHVRFLVARSARGPRHRATRRRHRRGIHRHAVCSLRFEARGRQRHLHAEGSHGRHHAVAGNDVFARSRHRLCQGIEGSRRLRRLRRNAAAGVRRECRHRLRRLRHRGAGVQVGRLQGRWT